MANRNIFIGKYTLQNLPPGPEGLGVDMSLSLDHDGVLKVGNSGAILFVSPMKVDTYHLLHFSVSVPCVAEQTTQCFRVC